MKFLDVIASRAFQNALWVRFLESIGIIWLGYEPFALFVPGLVPHGIGIYLFLLVVAAISGAIWAWPRHSITVSIPARNVEVTVKVGDLFDATDNVIIGINDVFDTNIGDDIISNRSLQAQLVQKRFGGSVQKFDDVIEAQLKTLPSTLDPSKIQGKNLRFQIGTVLQIEAAGIRHYLCAYCRMPASLKAETDICTILNALDQCWAKIRDSGENNGVSMPIIASDFGRTGLTNTQLVQIIVLSYVAADRTQHVAPSLTIYVHKPHAAKVDFAALRLWLRGVLWA